MSHRWLLGGVALLVPMLGAHSASAQPVPPGGLLQTAKLVAAGASTDDFTAFSVAFSDGRALVGARGDDGAGNGSGAAYVFALVGDTWIQEAKLVASDAEAFDQFGLSVALVGERALVGARGDDDAGNGSGSAYVFVRADGVWTQQAKLVASDAAAGDSFGQSVALVDDRAVVGADRAGGAGAAYVFVRGGDVWTQETRLAAVGTNAFGNAVALSGERAIVGAEGTQSGRGAAYVFRRTDETWTQESALIAADGAAGDRFGHSVALGPSPGMIADRAIVGAWEDSDEANAAGSAYIFARSGADWSQEAKLTAAAPTALDRFGTSVALQQSRAYVGVPGDDDRGTDSGSVHVFARSGGAWVQQPTVTASDGDSDDAFGTSISASNGNLLVGAYLDETNGPQSGSAYVFADVGLVANDGAPEARISLSAPVPNPTTGRASMRLTLDAPHHVRASVVDARGREVAVLFDAEATGDVRLSIDTEALAPGVYVVRVQGADIAEMRRFTVVR